MKTNAENSGYDIMDYFKYVDWEKELEELAAKMPDSDYKEYLKRISS